MLNSDQPHRMFRFGEFTLSTARGVLLRNQDTIKLRPQSFQVLKILLENHGCLVSKDDLHTEVWGHKAVTDDSLAQCLIDIRKVIGDVSRTMICTVPRRGFIFDLPVETCADPAANESGNGSARLRRWYLRPQFLIPTALTVGALAFWWLFGNQMVADSADPARNTVRIANSVAVVAFEDLSEGKDQQFFADGIAEEIISQLSVFPELNIVGRASSFLFKGQSVDIAAVAEQLSVLYVLTGSVRRSGDRIRITAQLIESDHRTQVWSESFDREMTVENLLDVQSEVATSVAAAIGLNVMSNAERSRSMSEPKDGEALDRYLEGLYFLRQIETGYGSEFDSAIARFDAAIKVDPNWAPPHAAKGRTLHFRASGTETGENDAWYRQSRDALMRAIEIDPEYAPAHESLGFVAYAWDHDFSGAEAAYVLALSLGDVSTWGYAILMRSMGRFDEAIELYRAALLRDPLSKMLKAQLARTYACAGRYADGIAAFEELFLTEPEQTDLMIAAAYIYLQIGDRKTGRELFEMYVEPESTPGLHGPIYAKLGMIDEAETALNAAESGHEWRPRQVALTALLLGQKKRALDYLEAAAYADPHSLMTIMCDVEMRNLAAEPQFQKMLAIVGFPR